MPVVRLQRRSEFLHAARGRKQGSPAFLLQAVPRGRPEPAVGVGITVTKKIGGAVVRNRARRRLREALRQVLPGPAVAGHDYVVVARPKALRQPFTALVADLDGAIDALTRRVLRPAP